MPIRSEKSNPNNKTKEFSIILPVYNKQNSIPIVYETLKNVLDKLGLDYEILFVNDASTDKSLQLLNTISNSNIQIINHEQNLGQIKAIESGLKVAKGKTIAIYSCDTQNSFDTIPELLGAITAGYDLAVGFRFTRSDKGISVLLSKIFFALLSRLEKKMPAGGFDFGMFNENIHETLKERDFNKIFLQLEVLSISKKTFYLPIERYSDKLDRSSWSLKDKIRYSVKIFKYLFK